jgi:hypothetical protein
MWPFKRYRVEIIYSSFDKYGFYVWRGGKIVGAGYRFRDPSDAANAANLKRDQLRFADRLIKEKD